MTSNKLSVQMLVSAFKHFGIRTIVISPGSRNAPLNLAFHLDDFFTVHSIVDERSAGFVALGMAQQLKQPVAICCTSGSAAVNYYPAVVEAFYQNIPLVVITADRPADLVDQFEGQTIRQNGLFSNHVHNQTVLNENLDADSQDQLMDCLTHLYQHQGPVHINMPFTEPLYQQAISQTWTWETHSTLVNNDPMDDALKRIWQNSPKRLILLGMHPPSPTLDALIDYWLQDGRTVVLSETTSNGHHPLLIHGIDQCITNMDPLDLPLFYPDLVMTVGQNVISKRIKSFLRAAQPHHIWHIDRHWAPETYGLITHHWAYALEDIMDIWIHQMPITHGEYQSRWVNIQTLKIKKHRSFQTEFSDWQAIYALSQSIPADWQIQWGNSSIVRYAQLMQWPKSIVHYANRGVSGIDGSTSTAVGACMVSGQNTLLVCGDLSFMYDINGLWNDCLPSNLRIMVINNGGGEIFNIIPGPDTTPNAQWFTTPHKRSMEKLAMAYGLNYYLANDLASLKETLCPFFDFSIQAKLLEINTQGVDNAQILKDYFQWLASTKAS